MRRLAAVSVAAALIVCGTARGAAAGDRVSLDPFRPASTPMSAPTSASALNPFRLADAKPANEPSGTAAPSPAAAATAPAAKACQTDDDCPAENFCAEHGVCEVIQTRTNVLYLYYHEGSFSELLGLYWSKKGPSGYRVVAPFYWHYWSPKGRTRVVAPIFWNYQDYASGYSATVIVPGLPISWSSQPDANSLGVWPLFYYSTKFGWAAPLFGSFEIADPDQHKSFGALFFLYWWKRSPQHTFQLGIPFFVSSRSAASAFTYALPLNFYWRNKDDKNLLVLPLLYWNQDKTGGSLYALTGYHTRRGPDSSGSLFWLYWFGSHETDHSGYDILFPLLWSFHSPASNTTVAGPVVHLRRQSWYFNVGFPVWWSGGDTAKNEAFRALIPLFYWQRSDHGKKALWLSPVGAYSRDDTEGARSLAILPLLTFTRRDRQSSLHVVTPLFVRYWSKESGATTKLISFLFYRREDPSGSTTFLFPLFWRFRDAPSGATATAVLPFFARRSSPDETSTYAGILPVWGYKRSFNDGGWGAGLFPLAFFGRRGDTSHGVIFPLFWRFKDGQKSTTVLAPIFYNHTDPHGSATGMLPLVFYGHHDGERYAIQFPLYWHFSSEREGWSTTVTPVGFHHTDRQGWSAGLPPLFFVGGGAGRSQLEIALLFWRFHDDSQQKTTTVLVPFMHRTHGGETTDAFFPFLYYRRGARPGGTEETSFTLFPLFHYRHDATTRVVATPLGAAWKTADREAGFVGFYLWYRGPNFTARGIPFLHLDLTNHVTGEHTRQYGPWFAIDAPGRRSRVLFPFFGTYDDASEHDTYVFPTYFRMRKTDGYAVDAVLPFYWHSHIGARSTKVIGLWYQHRDGGVHDTGLAPFYFYAKNNDRSLLVVPPLLLYRHADFKDNSAWLTAALLVYHKRGADSHTTVVFPLWWSGHEKERSHRVLFPLYWHFANQEQKSDVNFVGPVYWADKGTTRTRGLLPIAWYSRDSASGASSNAFLPLFYESHGARQFRFFTLLAGYSASETSHTWYALLAASSDSVERSFRMFFPIWFSHENKATEAKTRVIPPLLFVSRTTPQSSLTTAVALFWRYRDIASSTTLGLPLYYDFHEEHQSRTTVLLPFFVRHHRDADDSTYLIAPLFYRRTSPSDSTTVAFPLVWDFKRGNDRTTVVFPFYAHWRRPDHASTYIFPTYYYREGLGPKGPDGTYRRIVAPFFESAVKRRGDYMWEVLGGLFGNERIGRNNYLKVFFMTFETKAPAHTQTSWYSKPVRASRREATRGLNANVW